MPEVILPCPACGAVENESDKFGLSYRLGVQIVCHKCGMYGPVAAEDFNEAVGKWNTLPRALTWTHEPPKVAGWYFQRAMGKEKTQRIAFVSATLSGLHCKCGCSSRPLAHWVEFEWAGPIPEPLEPEES